LKIAIYILFSSAQLEKASAQTTVPGIFTT